MARLGDYNIRRIIFAILAVTWMVVIFSFSARLGEESENQSIKVLDTAVVCALVIGQAMPMHC